MAPPRRRQGAEQRYQLLLDTSLELASTLDLDEVLQSAARRLSAALQIPDCDIYRLEDDEHIVCVASTARRRLRHHLGGPRRSRLDDWPCDRLAVETGHAVTVTQPRRPAAEPQRNATDMRRYGQRSCVSLPLVARDKVIGLVDLLDRVERRVHRRGDRHRRGGRPARGAGPRARRALRRGQEPAPGQPARPELGAVAPRTTTPSATPAGWPPTWPCWARELGWPDERLEEVENVAFLHDIGKIGVSDRVLLKGGPLTSEEWELVRQHPGISAEIVRPLFDEELVSGVRHHHERFDGGGYPDGLAGEDDPADRPRHVRGRLLRRHVLPATLPAGARATASASPSCGAAPARSSTRTWSRPSCACCGACGGGARASPRWPSRPPQLDRPRGSCPAAHPRRRGAPAYAHDGGRPAPVARRAPAGALRHELRAGGRPVHHGPRHRRDRERALALRRPVAARRRARPRARRREPAGQRPERRRLRRLGVGHRAAVCDAQGAVVGGGHRRRAGRGVARPTRCRATARTRWRPCCSRPPSASAGPRSRPSPTASPASTTTATCTSASKRSSSAPSAARARCSLLFCDCDQFKVYNDDLRPQGRRCRPGAHRAHRRGLQPADRSGGALRRRGVRARAGRHRQRRTP